MSNQLEQIVRPSQAPSIRPGAATQIYTTPKVVVNEPVTWGSSGDSVFDLRAHSEAQNDTKWPESTRTFDVVRVYNPDDKESFVDTEVMTKFGATSKNLKAGSSTADKFEMTFSRPVAGENQEIMQKDVTRKSQP